MRRKLQKFITKSFGVAVLLSMLVGIAACNTNKDTATANNGRAPAEGSEHGGSVVIGITQEPGTFDPHTVVAAGDEEILFNIYEGLYKFNSEGNLEECLATSCVPSEDACEFVFTIREGVMFHNGEEMTVDDVVYSIERAAEYISELETIESVEAISDTEVKIVLTSANSEFYSLLTFGIAPRSVEDLHVTPVGTGPFKLEKYEIGQSITLVRNDNYWQDSLPYLDSVVFKICSDMDSALLELSHGNIDIIPHITMDRTNGLPENFEVVTMPSNMVQLLALNNSVAPFDNVEVRRALSYALDRQELIDLSMDGAGVALTTVMSPAMGDSYNSEVDGSFEYNPELAMELLAEAGYPDGFDMTITVASEYLVHVNTAVAIADQLSAVGINATIEQVDWNTWLSDVYTNHDYEASVVCLTSMFAPYDVVSRYHSENSGNFVCFANEDIDNIIDEIPTILAEDDRIAAYHSLLEMLVEECPSVYIQDPAEVTVVNSMLQGYEVYPMYVQDLSTTRYY